MKKKQKKNNTWKRLKVSYFKGVSHSDTVLHLTPKKVYPVQERVFVRNSSQRANRCSQRQKTTVAFLRSTSQFEPL